ncbi:MAG: NAD-dependent epimerase/dehydratase [Microgenomates group bacterium GW2011_GWA2_37_6]|nr:MAG: NAD-dependent epimerase/dehydratase [Microgenomates group bacterium GW2011_GWA2_37_6]
MALTTIFSAIERIIYDPIKGRIVYDLIVSLIFNFLIYFIFIFFEKERISVLFPLIYSSIYILCNFTLGLYGRNRTAILRNKITILVISNLAAFLATVFLFDNVFLSVFLFIINCTISISPRFFLNFNVERTTFKKIAGKQSSDLPILVVGGGGYIGSVLVEELLKRDKKVRVFDKFIYSKNVFKGIRNVKNLELIEGDISDIYSLTLAVKGTSAIVHLAAVVGDPAAEIDEELTRHVNIASTRLLKETAKAFSIEKFVFASSCSVYGFGSKIQTERSRPNPVSLYAKTKLDSEKELLSDTTDTFHPVILRFATVFGHSRKPRFDLVANLFVAQAYTNKNITNEKVGRKIFNVGDDLLNYTILDLAKTTASVIKDEKININFTGVKKDKRNYRVSFKKIKNELGFSSSTSLEQGVREIYENFLNKKYKKTYKDSFYINSEITKDLKREFRSKKYKKSHFTTIS